MTDADLIRPLMEQQPEYLRSAFDAAAQDYGDMASYTREGLAISDTTVAALRERLII